MPAKTNLFFRGFRISNRALLYLLKTHYGIYRNTASGILRGCGNIPYHNESGEERSPSGRWHAIRVHWISFFLKLLKHNESTEHFFSHSSTRQTNHLHSLEVSFFLPSKLHLSYALSVKSLCFKQEGWRHVTGHNLRGISTKKNSAESSRRRSH